MVNVKMNEEDVVELLTDRVGFWTKDDDIINLYGDMYESYVDGGCFDGAELDVMVIVDNDYVNYCDVIGEDDEHYDELVEAYNNGERDVSCNDVGYSFVEAYNPERKLLLVRW